MSKHVSIRLQQVAEQLYRDVDYFFSTRVLQGSSGYITVPQYRVYKPEEESEQVISIELVFEMPTGDRRKGHLRLEQADGSLYGVSVQIGKGRIKTFNVLLFDTSLHSEGQGSYTQVLCTYLFDKLQQTLGEHRLRDEITSMSG